MDFAAALRALMAERDLGAVRPAARELAAAAPPDIRRKAEEFAGRLGTLR